MKFGKHLLLKGEMLNILGFEIRSLHKSLQAPESCNYSIGIIDPTINEPGCVPISFIYGQQDGNLYHFYMPQTLLFLFSLWSFKNLRTVLVWVIASVRARGTEYESSKL